MDPEHLLAASRLTVNGREWSVEAATLGRLAGASGTVLMSDLMEEFDPGDLADVPAFAFAPGAELDLTVIHAVPTSAEQTTRTVVAQTLGRVTPGAKWQRITDGNGEDPVYCLGTMLTFTMDLVGQVGQWQVDPERQDAIAIAAIQDGALFVDGVAVLPASTGPAHCWAQYEPGGRIAALLADFDPFHL